MVDMVRERLVRDAMFAHLDRLLAASAHEVLSAHQTASFEFEGERYAMRQVYGQGIHKPRQLAAALSITTTSKGRTRYPDEFGEDGFPRYAYRGTPPDPGFWPNAALRTALDLQLPIAYFFAVGKGLYTVSHPVYVIADDPGTGTFTIGFTQGDFALDLANLSIPEKIYAARQTKQRLHQRVFRSEVLVAYTTSCAVCSLRHRELLDAAHIIDDSEDGGDPVVTNGLALCKIHHAAYDNYLLGITPTREVRVNRDLLREKDGPMLKHGLQDMHGRTIFTPRFRSARPDPERLAFKYEAFRQAS